MVMIRRARVPDRKPERNSVPEGARNKTSLPSPQVSGERGRAL